MILCMVSLSLLTGLEESPAPVPVPLHLMDPGNDCRWLGGEVPPVLHLADAYGEYSLIAPPEEGQDRDVWLQAPRQYRESVRQGARRESMLAFSYGGVRAWARLDADVAQALDVTPGEALTVQLDARWISGNPNLCIAFDIHSRSTGAKVGWTGVVATQALPEDGQWHRVNTTVRVPAFDPNEKWLRPIVGFDATRDSTPGQVEVRAIAFGVPDAHRRKVLAQSADLETPEPRPLDFSTYDRPDLQWLSHTFACHFTFMYDRSFYNPETETFTVEQFLDDGEREFGGYDAVLLWHAYPRIGLDDRNQFDFYRDMPGGLEGLRDVVRRLHARGVKAFINYNPWDRATRREGMSDEEALARMVATLDADGIFLDTMFASSPELRERVDARRMGVAFVPEAHPKLSDLPNLVGSWAQFPPNPFSPAMLHHKWIEPRHMEYQIRRWNTLVPGTDHAQEIENAFFNGSGMMIWENIFGAYNPWRPQDRATWRRAVAILRAFSEHFTSPDWDPFYPTLMKGLYAHRWPAEETTVFTLANQVEPVAEGPLLRLPWTEGMRCYDLWSGQPLTVRRQGEDAVVTGSVNWLGCVLAVRGDDPPQLEALLKRQAGEAQRDLPEVDPRAVAKSVVYPKPVLQTPAWTGDQPPEGMVYVPRTTKTFQIEHIRRECGCYPDPGTPEDKWLDSLQGWEWSQTMQHTVGPVEVGAFYIDETEVTNAQYKQFLDATGYRPEHPENFLKHWPNGQMPLELADHPVVYVDIDDARAYAKWAGKRLPTEEEWQLAAQSTDDRAWPWGPEDDASRVNTGGATMPVRSLPLGRSPYGCYHMSGNVYELTESVRDDGHTLFLMLRGGSYYDPNRGPDTASVWYMDGGPRPCAHHAKQILMWSGLDRCATLGFRSVKDASFVNPSGNRP